MKIHVLLTCAAVTLAPFSGWSAEVPTQDSVKSEEYKAKDYKKLFGMEGFSNDLLTMHFKLYEGYVKNANLLSKKLKEMNPGEKGKTPVPEFAGLKRMFGWEWDGMRLHEFYFDNLGGHGGQPDAKGELSQRIAKEFGSFDKWKDDFVSTGMMRGIGWVILYKDPQTDRLTNVWINEHDLGHLAGATPLLVMDVFEHAYMPQYGLNRDQYIDAFFKNINWDAVSSRL